MKEVKCVNEKSDQSMCSDSCYACYAFIDGINANLHRSVCISLDSFVKSIEYCYLIIVCFIT